VVSASPSEAKVAITCAYKRQNIIQEVLGAIWDVSQELVSEVITAMTPLIKEATREFVPTPEDAVAMVTGRVCLVDGSLDPCWSWESHDELWTRKHGTTGHNFQVVTHLDGEVLFISDPVPGSVHDSVAIKQTPSPSSWNTVAVSSVTRAIRAAGT